MDVERKVLVVDDQATEIEWLIYRLHKRGYEVTLATNEQAAIHELSEVESGCVRYRAAIFDIMVAVDDLANLMKLAEKSERDDKFDQSFDTGIRLCRLVRQDLGMSEKSFPIAALSVRDDDEAETSLKELGVPLYRRDAEPRTSDSIMCFVDRYLPDLNAEG